MRRLILLIMYIGLALVFVAGRHAHAESEWLMMASGYNPITNESEFIASIETDTQAACAYNMGMILGSWFEADMVGEIHQQYTEGESQLTVSFWDQNREWLIITSCAPIKRAI